ncbi:capsid decoration protein [Gordonia phage Gibbles]|uniref:Capsid decoration protein n=3 Tax=Gordonia phage Orchid TaxID=1838075 RepID=A0A160DH90_9CAUD|nr:head decoration [Gordonia phage Orchid]ANA87248.1 capsid decoration protein [Gordonia phage PatrickStar]ANA87361.1 capsid decoration protein [Gordonia phage Orchid]ANA87475.1 capsid decoration protein [Gordonia phage Kampe]QDK01972.1 capsid decoration protein [Gordonia phage Gibbles]
MPSFDKPDQVKSTPFGKNQYLHSTRNKQLQGYTFAHETLPEEDWTDGTGDVHTEKILQSGEVLAKITSGPNSGKVGVFQTGATDGRATLANIVGVNDTFAPWQLSKRDIEVAALYHGVVKQAWCFIRDANGDRVVMPDNVADALRGGKGLDVLCK